jgi:hypothetical protein
MGIAATTAAPISKMSSRRRPMVLKLICARMLLGRVALRGAFTLGAIAGTAGVIGLCALRKAVTEKREA